MKYTREPFKHCDLIKISGRIDSATYPELEAALNELLEAGHFNIVLDMSEVEFISSAGLRLLINVQKACRKLDRGELV
ncbi:MAG TPA: STAS domain-containing protein, partial [Anaerolineae bacterium]|nr:STAS domain-containing protein [Anaerolineae bacterium]